MSEAFPDFDEACDRMLVAIRIAFNEGRAEDARVAARRFARAMRDGDDARMRHELGAIEGRGR
jgi:hypothetical protein